MISFITTPEQARLIVEIATRAETDVFAHIPEQDRLATIMDLSATIAQGVDLDLEKLLAFDAFNFAHDVGGIYRHIDRTTGLLGDCFLPRCAVSSPTQQEIDDAIETIKRYGAVPAAPGRDLHRLTAARIFGVKPEDVTDAQRKYAKIVNYSAQYSQPWPGASK